MTSRRDCVRAGALAGAAASLGVPCIESTDVPHEIQHVAKSTMERVRVNRAPLTTAQVTQKSS